MRRRLSQREAARREKQRKTLPPNYRALLDNDPPSLPSDVEPRSAGARSALLAPRPPPLEIQPLLVNRAQARKLLSVSTASLIRFEKLGVLRPVKLNRSSPSAQTFYAFADLVILASGR
jgi:hypothetical protein